MWPVIHYNDSFMSFTDHWSCTCWTTLIFQDPLNRTAAPPIIEKTKKQTKQQAPSTADLNKQVVSQVCHLFANVPKKKCF